MVEPACVELRSGRLHIPAAVYEELFTGCPSVALLARDGAWWLMPLLAGAGGLQVKLRNAHGDRVVEAQEFFRAQGLEDTPVTRRWELRFVEGSGAFQLLATAG